MFTLADVEAAVEATGLTPHAGDFMSDEGCLCPASILVVAKHGKEEVLRLAEAKEVYGLREHVLERLDHFSVTLNELDAFVGGVDGGIYDDIGEYFGNEFGPAVEKAYELGLAVRKRYSLK